MKTKRPSMTKAIRAKCRDCMCDHIDGRRDCHIPTCSLYYWMPYRGDSEPSMEWIRPKRQSSPAQLAALAHTRLNR